LDVEIGGRDNPRSAPVLHNLAELLQDKGESAQAETLYRQALAIDEQA
jgi:Tfp pilus assembly protein PilF